MASSSIKAGLKVITAKRVLKNGTPRGGVRGVIDAIIRHPLSGVVTAVILNTGSDDPDERVVVSPRWLVAEAV
ncbi:hypothetical protein SEA_KEANU_79 [Streptomyces phage Keanu]|nr:hypothetical protein SEA_KEANU_79 [Streptomyces phage Keanu]